MNQVKPRTNTHSQNLRRRRAGLTDKGAPIEGVKTPAKVAAQKRRNERRNRKRSMIETVKASQAIQGTGIHEEAQTQIHY